MSCLKCGSGWVTAAGKNCASCPHCCKQARCRARKEGRWSIGCGHRDCVECGKTFTPMIGGQNAKTCSPECKIQHRRKWRREHIKGWRKGVRKCVQVHGARMPLCLNCGKKEVLNRRHSHCSRECYQESRRKGVVSWDRTGQLLGIIRRRRAQGLPMPSQVMYASIQSAMKKHFAAIESMWKQINRYSPCKNCGGPLKVHAREFTMFCSIPCAAAYEHEEACRCCGAQHKRIGVQGKRGSMCRKCKRKARNKHRKHTKGIAQRAKKYGVLRVKYGREEIFCRDGWQCQLCGVALRRKWTYNKKTFVPHPHNATIDHIKPMSKGGDDAEWNVQACCLNCNGKKSATEKGQLRLKLW